MRTEFVSKLLSQPWHISEMRGRALMSVLLQRLRGERPAESVGGRPLPTMQVVGDVAVIPIYGSMMLDVPDWLKEWGLGLTDANDIELELNQALNDPAVELIMLDIDSPGGVSHAGAKLFDLVEAANRKKPVGAFAGDGREMCSAAYNTAAPCLAIYTGKYATVGSIGTYWAVMNDAEFWKMNGITWEVFRSGEFKGIGVDGINDEQRAFMQEVVDSWGAQFRKNVSKYRTGIAPEDMQGQWFNGDEAVRRGFTHGIVKDFAGAVKRVRALL